MRRFSFSTFFIGIGLGLIFSYFFLLNNKSEFDPAKEITKIPDEIVIQRAIELGLIDPSSGIEKQSIEQDLKGK